MRTYENTVDHTESKRKGREARGATKGKKDREERRRKTKKKKKGGGVRRTAFERVLSSPGWNIFWADSFDGQEIACLRLPGLRVRDC